MKLPPKFGAQIIAEYTSPPSQLYTLDIDLHARILPWSGHGTVLWVETCVSRKGLYEMTCKAISPGLCLIQRGEDGGKHVCMCGKILKGKRCNWKRRKNRYAAKEREISLEAENRKDPLTLKLIPKKYLVGRIVWSGEMIFDQGWQCLARENEQKAFFSFLDPNPTP